MINCILMGMRYNTITKTLLAAVFLMTACSHQKTWLQSVPMTKLEVSRDVEFLPIPGDSIVMPEILATCGDYVLWSEKKGDELLRISDCDGNLLSSDIKKGRASGELLNITQILVQDHDFILCDVLKNKAYSFVLEGHSVDRVNSFDIGTFSTIAVAGDTIVGIAKHGNYKYESKLLDGNTISKFGNYSFYGLDVETGCSLLRGHICINDALGRTAVFGYCAGAYEIADYRRHKIVRSEKLEDFSFDGKVGGQVLMGPESKLNFISVSSSETYIYALYDGKDLNYYMSNQVDSPSGNTICVFDWDGNYVKSVHLDYPVTCIAWNPDDNSLYISVLMDCDYRIGTIKSNRLCQ